MQIHLVTGGAGFLGSHLIDRLMEAGDEVICLDNYFTGRKANIARGIDLARQQLDWQPTVSLEQGLPPTIDAFRNLLGHAEGRGT